MLFIKLINASSNVDSSFFSSNITICSFGKTSNNFFLKSYCVSEITAYCFVPSLLSFISFIFSASLILFLIFFILSLGSSTVTNIVFLDLVLSSKFEGVSIATIFPLFIIITFSHI